MLVRRLTLILCAGVVIYAVTLAWEDDVFARVALILGALFVGMILLAGWRQLDREARDAAQIARSRANRRAGDRPEDASSGSP